MATLSVQTIGGPSGLVNPSAAAASAGGDAFPNPSDERTFLYVKNGGGSPITVTVAPVNPTTVRVPGAAGAIPVPNRAMTVPASQEGWLGPFPTAFNDANGNVNVSYSAVTSVTVAARRLPAESL